VWEINTLPTFGQPPGFEKPFRSSTRRKARETAKELFYEELCGAIKALGETNFSGKIPVKLPKSISRPLAREERKQKFVDAAVKLGEKIPRIPFLNDLRTVIKRKLRSKNESAPKI